MQVMGQTGAVSPGLCGTARAATEGEEQAGSIGEFSDGLGGFKSFVDFVVTCHHLSPCSDVRPWCWSGSHPMTMVARIW